MSWPIGTLPARRQPRSQEVRPRAILYATCTVCHGASGQGVWSTNAPRLAHMSDWYLKRQLQNFRQGLRGAHPQDFNGAQMAVMARPLADEQAVNDVLAHIDALWRRGFSDGIRCNRRP
jgi:cytochrome c553